jgi:hypothetical protein
LFAFCTLIAQLELPEEAHPWFGGAQVVLEHTLHGFNGVFLVGLVLSTRLDA